MFEDNIKTDSTETGSEGMNWCRIRSNCGVFRDCDGYLYPGIIWNFFRILCNGRQS
jgi:hypothetical protein